MMLKVACTHGDELLKETISSVLARRNINSLIYVNDTTLMAEGKELKSLLMKVKEESRKS